MQSTITQNGQRIPINHPLHLEQRIQTGLNGTTSNGDLIINSQRHHRDLFSGSLGIPNVSTHVGNVIHAFETMAQNRSTPTTPNAIDLNDSNIKPYTETGSSTKSLIIKNSKKFKNKKSQHLMQEHDYRKELFNNNNKIDNINNKYEIHNQYATLQPNYLNDNNNYDDNINYYNQQQQQHQQLKKQHHHNHHYNHQENLDDDQFLRGSTVSQSFIKNVPKYSSSNNNSNNNINSIASGSKRERISNSTGRLTKKKNPPDPPEPRYKKYSNSRNSNLPVYKPRTLDRADL